MAWQRSALLSTLSQQSHCENEQVAGWTHKFRKPQKKKGGENGMFEGPQRPITCPRLHCTPRLGPLIPGRTLQNPSTDPCVIMQGTGKKRGHYRVFYSTPHLPIVYIKLDAFLDEIPFCLSISYQTLTIKSSNKLQSNETHLQPLTTQIKPTSTMPDACSSCGATCACTSSQNCKPTTALCSSPAAYIARKTLELTSFSFTGGCKK